MDKISDVSFVVGVTGHRDLAMDNEAAVSEQIDTFLTELQTALGPFPVTIACGMADGADRLVAHRALKLGIAVQAVLPMPTRYYLSDFSTDSAEELETLLAHENVSLHEIPLPAETSSVAISEPSAARDGLHTGVTTYAFFSHIPCLKSLSRLGVLACGWPERPSAHGA